MPIETPRMEAIEDAAGFIGIEPERMKAAIDLYEQHMKRAEQPDMFVRPLPKLVQEGFDL